MNASISGMIDLLFKDTAMNNETRALYEELLNNCQEHYDDLIGRGLSETEALDAVPAFRKRIPRSRLSLNPGSRIPARATRFSLQKTCAASSQN